MARNHDAQIRDYSAEVRRMARLANRRAFGLFAEGLRVETRFAQLEAELAGARTEHACELARVGAHHDAALRPLRERLAAAEARAARYEGDGAAEKDALALLERGRRVGAAHRIQVRAEGLFRIFFEFSRHR